MGYRQAYSANEGAPKTLLLNCKLDGEAYGCISPSAIRALLSSAEDTHWWLEDAVINRVIDYRRRPA